MLDQCSPLFCSPNLEQILDSEEEHSSNRQEGNSDNSSIFTNNFITRFLSNIFRHEGPFQPVDDESSDQDMRKPHTMVGLVGQHLTIPTDIGNSLSSLTTGSSSAGAKDSSSESLLVKKKKGQKNRQQNGHPDRFRQLPKIIETIADGTEGYMTSSRSFQRDSYGKTTLHHAVSCGDIKALRQLISQGCTPWVNDYSGNTLLHIAVTTDNMEMIKEVANLAPGLLSKANAAGETPLTWAIDKDSPETVQTLHDLDRANNKGQATLIMHRDAGYTIVERAIEKKSYKVLASIPSPGYWIHAACKNSRTPLINCVLRNDYHALRAFNHLDYWSDHTILPDSLKSLALRVASEHESNHECFKFLIDSLEFKPYLKDHEGLTLPLYLARNGNNYLYNWIAENFDLPLEERGPDGNTTLHFAAQAPDPALLAELTKYNRHLVDLNNNAGETPLVTALQHGNLISALILLCNGANLSTVNHYGQPVRDQILR